MSYSDRGCSGVEKLLSCKHEALGSILSQKGQDATQAHWHRPVVLDGWRKFEASLEYLGLSQKRNKVIMILFNTCHKQSNPGSLLVVMVAFSFTSNTKCVSSHAPGTWLATAAVPPKYLP